MHSSVALAVAKGSDAIRFLGERSIVGYSTSPQPFLVLPDVNHLVLQDALNFVGIVLVIRQGEDDLPASSGVPILAGDGIHPSAPADGDLRELTSPPRPIQVIVEIVESFLIPCARHDLSIPHHSYR
jgi:hypothetical protein